MNNIEKAEEKIAEAEVLFKSLEKRGLENIDVPESVLKQKLYVQKGLIAKKQRKYREACELFALSMENCELYDPKTKKEYNFLIFLANLFERSLKELQEIFELFQLDTTHIDEMLDKFRPLIKDIVFLVDISESMTGIKIIKAIESILKVYNEYIKDYDRVGYILFNEKVHSIFSLDNKIHNDAYFRSVLAKIPMYNNSNNFVFLMIFLNKKGPREALNYMILWMWP